MTLVMHVRVSPLASMSASRTRAAKAGAAAMQRSRRTTLWSIIMVSSAAGAQGEHRQAHSSSEGKGTMSMVLMWEAMGKQGPVHAGIASFPT